MGADDILRLDRQLCFALYRAQRAVTRAYAPLLEPLGLTYPQYLAMLALWEADGVPVKRLGEQLGLDSATLTPLLKRLESQKLVTRRRDADDERVVRIHLTDRGRALRTKARAVPTSLACRAGFDVAHPPELARLSKLRDELHAIVRTLDEADSD
jgi:DNA-binding MarR family transcriptional regulator